MYYIDTTACLDIVQLGRPTWRGSASVFLSSNAGNLFFLWKCDTFVLIFMLKGGLGSQNGSPKRFFPAEPVMFCLFVPGFGKAEGCILLLLFNCLDPSPDQGKIRFRRGPDHWFYTDQIFTWSLKWRDRKLGKPILHDYNPLLVHVLTW